MKSRLTRLLIAGLATAWAAGLQAEPQADLANQGYALLKRYCYRCHGQEFRAKELNVLSRQVLTAASPGKPAYLVAGKPADSLVWQRAGIDKDMPPAEESQRPTATELDILRQWIEAEAPFPPASSRPFVTEADVLKSIRDHLLANAEEDRPYLRYFAFANLHNQREGTEERDLQLARAALSKLINSLSWQEGVVLPRAVADQPAVMCIDVRKLGWDRSELWQEVMQAYPYGLKHDHDADAKLATVAAEVYQLAACEMPYVRADWFIATASRPPLYHKLLELPETLDKLEERLKVDAQADFRDDRLLRAGLAQSGVSKQNRLIDRHAAAYGAFWITYDFKPQDRTQPTVRRNIFQHPLGPVTSDHPFAGLAFQHDGGEMIFHLPNGLQGFFLTDAKGKRIDAGPIDVVADTSNASGTPEVVTGISCMACHDKGLRPFVDRLATGLGVFGDARRKVQRLIGAPEQMERLIDEDQQRYRNALKQTCGPFFPEKQGDGPTPQTTDPIYSVAKQFQRDLGAAEVATELGLADVDQLKQLIQVNPQLRTQGLGPLLEGGSIKRDQWQSSGRLLSQFQIVANALDRGTPFRFSLGSTADARPSGD